MAMPIDAIDPVQESILEACVFKAWQDKNTNATVDDVIDQSYKQSLMSLTT